MEKQDSLENRFAMYWLNRLGIATIVLGFVFLILYSYQIVGPVVKLAAGLVAAAALVAGGEVMAAKDSQKWFANSLWAGGWSLAYFTAYAAYFVPSVQIIQSPAVEAIALCLVSAGSFISSLRARSELMSIFSLLLACGAIMMTQPGPGAGIVFVVLAVTASILGNRLHWHKLFACAIAACYFGIFFCRANPAVNAVTMCVYLSVLWLTFSLGIGYSLQRSIKSKEYVIKISCLNAGVFGLGLLSLEGAIAKSTIELLLVATASIYFVIARWLYRHAQEELMTVHLLLGLTLINCAKAIKLSGLQLLSFDVMQIALLAAVGWCYNLRSFRWSAVVLTICFIPLWLHQHLLPGDTSIYGIWSIRCGAVGLWAAIAFAGLAHLFLKRRSDSMIVPASYGAFGKVFYVAANLMCMFLAFHFDIQWNWICFLFILLAAVNTVIGLRLNNAFYSDTGIVIFSFTYLVMMITPFFWAWFPSLCIVGACYGLCGYSRHLLKTARAENGLLVKWTYGYSACAMLTTLLWVKLPADLVSLSLGIEGLCLLILGFLIRERFIRTSALFVLTVLAAKLLILDMAHYDTLERIVSFIAGGFIFVLTSYIYARFTRAFETARTESPDLGRTEISMQGAPDLIKI